MRLLPASIYLGDAYDSNICVIVPEDPADVPALLAFAHSGALTEKIREIEPGAKVNNGTFEMVPFDLREWHCRAQELFPTGLAEPSSIEPNQWIFSGSPVGSAAHLHTAVARLVGYSWPRQTSHSVSGCSQLAPDGLGRYAADDGILCLSAIRGEAPAHDRLNTLLANAFGASWSAAKLANLLAEIDFAGKTLDDWLRDGFFQQHCELFQQWPFVWHIWDGRRDGFHALVNYHRLTAQGGEGRREQMVRLENVGGGHGAVIDLIQPSLDPADHLVVERHRPMA